MSSLVANLDYVPDRVSSWEDRRLGSGSSSELAELRMQVNALTRALNRVRSQSSAMVPARPAPMVAAQQYQGGVQHRRESSVMERISSFFD